MADPLTVTAACAGARFSLAVKVLTGAGGPGAVINNGATTATLTPNASGSRIYGAGYFYGGHGSPSYYDPASAATVLINDSWQASGEAVMLRSASPTAAGTPVTLAWTDVRVH